jgi:hypothetical protein
LNIFQQSPFFPCEPEANRPSASPQQTGEEKELWRALRERQFAGFKFRRQYVIAGYVLDFLLCRSKAGSRTGRWPDGLPEKIKQDEVRQKCLAGESI